MSGVAAISVVDAGCNNSHLLGAVDGGGGTGGTQSPSMDAQMNLDDGASPPDVPGNVRDGAIIAESWTGYAENFMFRSGSDAVRFSFLTEPSGQIVGYVSFGTGTPPPPPTDPNVGYPADLLRDSFDLNVAPRTYLAEGYPYEMRAATLVGARLRFAVDTWQLWRQWCALQTPAGTSGMCVPNSGFMVSGDRTSCGLFDEAANQYVPVDCGKLALCGLGGVCICGASDCMVREDGNRITFDITFDDLRASGSASGPIGLHNVQFTKDQ
jgi:hypothetical protein